MSLSWTEFLRDTKPAAHGVQIYRDVDELAVSVSAYLASGFERGDPGVVIATPEHWARFADRLWGDGWGSAELEDAGLLWVLDAELTLSSFMVDGHPSPERFDDVLNGVLDEIRRRFTGHRVRAFGEMVDVLSQRGEADAAAELEDLWEGLLASRRDLSLLCGYGLDLFDRATQVFALPRVCGAHSHILPAADSKRFQHVVDAALDEALGTDANKVYALAAKEMPGKQMPAAQLALMWISAHMPVHAERVLDASRRRYADETLPT